MVFLGFSSGFTSGSEPGTDLGGAVESLVDSADAVSAFTTAWDPWEILGPAWDF